MGLSPGVTLGPTIAEPGRTPNAEEAPVETIVRIQLSPLGRLAYRVLVGLFAAATLVLLMHGNAWASSADGAPVNQGPTITVDAGLWRYGSGLLVPIIGGLLLKQSDNPKFKVLINVILSAIAGVAQTAFVQDGIAVISRVSIDNAVWTAVVAIASLYGVWKPLGVDDTVKATGRSD